MFGRKTLLVVGAGASHELNLPTGEKLKANISELLDIRLFRFPEQPSGDAKIRYALESISHANNLDFEEFLNKCAHIRDAMPGSISIDNFLDAHSSDHQMVTCGKLAIAKAILDAERSSRLFVANKSRLESVFNMVSSTWMIPFFKLLTENVGHRDLIESIENVTIINFNYDRCIEEFIPRALMAYYGIGIELAEEYSAFLKIIHPYGQVGSLSKGTGGPYHPFGSNNFDLTEISHCIRTFTEGLSDERLGRDIKIASLNAEQIIFLGFAFHPTNLQLIATKNPSRAKKIFATTLNLSEPAKRVIRGDILNTFDKSDPKLPKSAIRDDRHLDEINMDNLGAAEFLESHFRGIA